MNWHNEVDMKMYWYLPFLLLVVACGQQDDEQLPPPPITANTQLKNFGFTIVDTYWDDPTDEEVKTNYADEVYTFCNIADILVVNPTDDLQQRMTDMAVLDMKVVLHLNELFFELVDANSPSGANYDLRADYQQRWDAFKSLNQLDTNKDKISSFYIGEEPTWNGITYEELKAVTDYVKAQFPEIPIMIIEAYPAIADLQIPQTVDWVGFDHYFIKNPNIDSSFQQEWSLIKSKRSTPDQKLVVVMDTHYINWAHGDASGIALDEMKDVATNYYNLAKSDTSVVTMIGYFWPNGFDIENSIGARGMPQAVQEEYRRIGHEITGK